MDISWNERDPIYRQLHDRLVEMILEGVFRNGDALPSVRQISTEHRINPITVSKAFQLLVDEGVVEKKRGLGMYVMPGAREQLNIDEREHFLQEEWPRLVEKIRRLGLSAAQLLSGLPDTELSNSELSNSELSNSEPSESGNDQTTQGTNS